MSKTLPAGAPTIRTTAPAGQTPLPVAATDPAALDALLDVLFGDTEG
jgi:hypothetical protein